MNLFKFFSFTLFSCIFLFGCNSNKKELFPIPADADLVVKVNLSKITRKVALDKLEEFNVWDLFRSTSKDNSQRQSALELIMAHPNQAGIDYLDEIYLYHRNRKVYLVAKLDDKDKFEQYCHELPISIADYRNKFLSDSNFSIHYNNNFLITNLVQKESLDSLQYLLSISNKNTFLSDSILACIQKRPSDILAFCNVRKLMSETIDPDYLNLLSDKLVSSEINFKDEKLEVEIETLFHPIIEAHFNSINKKLIENLNKENTLSYTTFNFDLDSNILGQNKIGSLLQSDINPSNVLQSFGGEFHFYTDKLNMKKRIFKSYSLDDNFNKIESIDSSTIYYPGFTMVIAIKEDQYINDVLNQLTTSNILNKKNKNNFQTDLFDVPIFLTTYPNNKIVIISDTITTISEYKDKLSTERSFDSTCFFSYVNFKKLPTMLFRGQEYLKEIDVKGIKNNKGKIKVFINLYLADSNKNSLLTLIDLFKRVDHKITQ
jgi:hypothetical protein